MVEREPVPLPAEEEEEEERGVVEADAVDTCRSNYTITGFFYAPVKWLRMLAAETNWSFVVAVVIVNGVSQGFGGALTEVATDYYMKDVLKVQPSEAQIYSGIAYVPWIVKPLWGLLTDVVPMAGYRRRPYLLLAGLLGVLSMFLLSTNRIHLVIAVALLTGGNASVAVADVTVDACVAENSISRPTLAADMQALCSLSESLGALTGFVISGIAVDLFGSMGVFGLLMFPAGLVALLGLTFDEPLLPDFSYKQVGRQFTDAGKAMFMRLSRPAVWRPCVYMYVSFALSLDISDGMFYWYTDAKNGPLFSQEIVGLLFSAGSVGSITGGLLYQLSLKDHPFRRVCLWTQIVSSLSGMLDLLLVLRLNLKYGVPDSSFAVADRAVSQMIKTLKWMPFLVLGSKMCPVGIEGTFFALLMSIDNFGVLSSRWLGGLLLHILGVTKTRFNNLWLAILIRNALRVSPLCLLFLIPDGDPKSTVFLADEVRSPESVELVALVDNTNSLMTVQRNNTQNMNDLG